MKLSLNDVDILLSSLTTSNDELRSWNKLPMDDESHLENEVRMTENKELHDRLLDYRSTLV